MTEPIVSVIIPAYNSGKYIEQCINSVRMQTFQDWEAIIVYSPSTDDTLEKCIEAYRNDPRIQLITEDKKSNCATARNRGIHASKGKYIAMLDADDWWQPEKLRGCVTFLEMYPGIDWVFHWLYLHMQNETIACCEPPGFAKTIWGVGGIMFRRSLLNKIESKWGYIFNEGMDRTDDADLVLRIRRYPAGCIPVCLSHYRWNEGSLTAHTKKLDQSVIMIKMDLRNRAFDYLPLHMRELTLDLINEVFGCDIVAWKKRVFK